MSASVYLALATTIVPPYGGVRLSLVDTEPTNPEYWGGKVVLEESGDAVYVCESRHDPISRTLMALTSPDEHGIEWVTLDEEAGGVLLCAADRLAADFEERLADEYSLILRMREDDDPHWREIGLRDLAGWEARVASGREITRENADQLRSFLRRAAGRRVVVAYM
jgi:hypothetical protein